ncbi:hypothetical protein BHM03_00049499 [Ensete ventricosum]|nr:hypothetical protein BHM03_00049499 [Ensete ventricosum]
MEEGGTEDGWLHESVLLLLLGSRVFADSLQVRPPYPDPAAPMAATMAWLLLLRQDLCRACVLGMLLPLVAAGLLPVGQRRGGDEEVDVAPLQLRLGRDDQDPADHPLRAAWLADDVVGVGRQYLPGGDMAAVLLHLPTKVHHAYHVEGAAREDARQAAPKAVAHLSLLPLVLLLLLLLLLLVVVDVEEGGGCGLYRRGWGYFVRYIPVRVKRWANGLPNLIRLRTKRQMHPSFISPENSLPPSIHLLLFVLQVFDRSYSPVNCYHRPPVTVSSHTTSENGVDVISASKTPSDIGFSTLQIDIE